MVVRDEIPSTENWDWGLRLSLLILLAAQVRFAAGATKTKPTTDNSFFLSVQVTLAVILWRGGALTSANSRSILRSLRWLFIALSCVVFAGGCSLLGSAGMDVAHKTLVISTAIIVSAVNKIILTLWFAAVATSVSGYIHSLLVLTVCWFPRIFRDTHFCDSRRRITGRMQL